MSPLEGVARLVGSPWLRCAGALCLVAIVILSLTPGNWQHRTGMPGPFEHWIAYCITAMVMTLGARSSRFPGTMVVALVVLAAAMELLQYWSPGRDPGLIGFVGGSIGAAVGALLAFAARKRVESF